MAYSAKYTFDEAAYKAQRTGRYVGGQLARVALRAMTAVGAVLAGVSGTATGLYFTGAIGFVSGVGLQGYLNHKDYEHSKEMLASMYRKEMASYFDIDSRFVTVKHLELMAKVNPTIDEHIDKQRNIRNVSTGMWAIAGALGLAAAIAIAPASLLLAGVGGMATLILSQPLIEKAGEKIYRLNEPTTVDLIKNLEWKRTKNQKVSHTQVMQVYVSATPALQNQIKQQYGKDFMQLGIAQQQHIILQHGPTIMLDDVTQAINENRMNARELVFRVHNDISGAYPDPSYKEQWDNGISQVKEKAQEIQQNISQKGQQAFSTVRNFVSRNSDEVEEVPSEEVSTKFQDAELARRAERGQTNQIGS